MRTLLRWLAGWWWWLMTMKTTTTTTTTTTIKITRPGEASQSC